ncbi:MAG: enoyl-CoA hydratase/isomerase family protein [Thermoanaerobaculales bacterium]|nr:enoyl-CoA hydratase/isomerase family protein [Thermoanaerobaculales bacterium]
MPQPRSDAGVLELSVSGGTVHAVLARPILDRAALNALAAALTDLAAAPQPLPLVLRSAHPRVFLAGADLAEIAELDAGSCRAYSELGRRVVRLLGQHPAAAVAAVHGPCSGGGFDIVMACDAVVVSPDASFQHPGVRRGLVTGWSGTAALPAAIGRTAARAALLEARAVDAPTAVAVGLARRLSDDPVPEATALASRLGRLDGARLQLWRQLRGPRFVDSFRASVVHK